jgi:hypothetical protein
MGNLRMMHWEQPVRPHSLEVRQRMPLGRTNLVDPVSFTPEMIADLLLFFIV